MNVAVAFHSGDAKQFTRWLDWSEKLGGVGSHRMWVMAAREMSDRKLAGDLLFTGVEDSEGISGWPAAPNSMWQQFAWHFYIKKLGPWLFCEPDCVPLNPGWLDALESEYLAAGKPFMGAFVPGKANSYPDHLTGNAIYPEDTPIQAPAAMMARNSAWDIVGAKDILPKAHITKLIQHIFKRPEFTSSEEVERVVSKEAVLFHANKGGSLIPFLSARNGVAGEPSPGGDVPHETPGRETTNRVFTYFRPGHGEFVDEQKKLLALWEESWKANGWEPVILTEHDARLHPRFEEWDAALRKLPVKNPIGYEMACFHRWIAFAHEGANLWTDYDVMANGFKPPLEASKFHLLAILCGHVPCSVIGNRYRYESEIDGFIRDGCASDMQYFARTIGSYISTTDCVEYGQHGWHTAKLVHFSHAACGKEPRSAIIEKWKLRKAEAQNGPMELNHKLISAPELLPERLIATNTRIDELRRYVASIQTWVSGKSYRLQAVHKELRAAGLIREVKKRKAKKWDASLR